MNGPGRDPHLHLYGALTPGQALDLAAGHAVDWGWLAGRWLAAGLAVPDFAAVARRHRAGEADADRELELALAGGPAGFAAFQARYDVVVACSRWATGRHDRWEAATAGEVEQVCALVAAGGPAEARVLLPAAATPAWCAAALDQLAVSAARHGLGLAISLPRRNSLRHWPAVVAAAERHAGIGAVDVCGIEDEPAQLAPLAAAVTAYNHSHPRRLALLIHVGEQLRAVQPLTAVRWVGEALALGADRLGHALAIRLDPAAWPDPPAWERSDERLARLGWLLGHAGALGLAAEALTADIAALAGRDPASQHAAEPTDRGLLRACQELVLAQVRDSGRVIEVCPSSNRMISGTPLERHGLERLVGCRWVVGSDDPGILGTDLAREQAAVAAVLGRTGPQRW
jgi:hypothetical protein